MPARKPAGLQTGHDTLAEKAQRADVEQMLTPKTELTAALPPVLRKGHEVAAQTWKRVVSLFLELDRKIVTAFDYDLLIKYCLLEEEARELALMRKQLRSDWETQSKAAKKISLTDDNLKSWVQMWTVINALFARFQGLDARLDGKRKLLHAIAQSLYLTPRSRAGVPPEGKPPEPLPDEMDQILDEPLPGQSK
jgi:hypothetical protein